MDRELSKKQSSNEVSSSVTGQENLTNPQELGGAPELLREDQVAKAVEQTPPSSPLPPAPLPTSAAAPTSQPPTSQSPQTGMPQIADDTDLIEKEWVDKAKEVVARTAHDPYLQNKEMNKVKAEYLKKRYNKDIRQSD